MMLHIPLRARLTTPRENTSLSWRQIFALMRIPEGLGLLDTQQPKLPALPRRCYGRSPGRRSKSA